MGARWVRVLLAVGFVAIVVLGVMQLTGNGLHSRRSGSSAEAIEVHENCRRAVLALGLDVKRQIDATLDPTIKPPYMVICTVELTSGTVQQIGVPPVGAPVLLEPAP